MNTDIQPYARDNAISIGDALRSQLQGDRGRDAYIASYEAELRQDPENTWPLGICKKCGSSLGDTADDKVIPIATWGFLPNVICSSCSQAGIEEIEKQKRADRDKGFARIVPVEFNVWDSAKGNGQLLARVTSTFNFSSRKGMVIHGGTGSCKTRVAWQLLKRIVEQPDGFTWAFLDAFECATKGFPDEAAKVDFLFLDDLGNEPTSTKYETALLHLIRKRCDWHKPVIVTTQLTARAFKEKYFSGSAAEAVMRRFKERSDSIDSTTL